MAKRISNKELREITRKYAHISDHAKDEMAIPSYLHKNILIRWLMWKRYDYISDLANFDKHMIVLEFGCGSGVYLPELSEKCDVVYAIDLFPEYAKFLNSRHNLGIVFPDKIEDIPDNSLDIIIAADVLEHIEDLELIDLLKTFSQKLKSNGRIIVSGPTENYVYKIGRIVAGFSGKGDYHHTNINSLIDVIGQSFMLKNIKYLPFRFPPHLFKICEFSN